MGDYLLYVPYDTCGPSEVRYKPKKKPIRGKSQKSMLCFIAFKFLRTPMKS